MKAYRLLTAEDSSDFCHKVTKALNQGWELYGDPQFCFDDVEGKRYCAQAVIKTVEGQDYAPHIKLGEL